MKLLLLKGNQRQNQQWQQSPVVQPQLISTPLPAPKKKMNSLMIGCLFLISIPIILDAPFYSMSFGKVTKNENSLVSNSVQNSTPPLVAAPNLSSKENLLLGKSALSDGSLTTAKNHLSAISKDAKEFASAKQYLATIEKREKRKAVEDELEKVKIDQANVEEMLDATEDFGEQAGSPKKAIYSNALKRKGQLQLRRIELERKLKNMP